LKVFFETCLNGDRAKNDIEFIASCMATTEGNARWNTTEAGNVANGECLEGFQGEVSRPCVNGVWGPISQPCQTSAGEYKEKNQGKNERMKTL